MKTKNLLLMAALAGTVFTGCSNDEELTSNAPDLTDTPILVNAGVNNLVATRAGYESGSEPDYFYFSINQGNNRYSWYNVKMEKKNEQWAPANLSEDKQLLWASSNPDAKVYAFTRGNENQTLTAINLQWTQILTYMLEVPIDQTTAETVRQADILYCYKENVNPETNGTISLDFDHAMSKLVISYSFGTELSGTTDKLTSCTIGKVGWYGEISMGGTEAQPAVDPDNMETITAYVNEGSKTVECIIVPQEFATRPTATFTVDIDGKVRTFTCEVKVDELIANTCYTMNVTIGRDKVEVNSVTVTPWGDPQDIGKIETE